MEKLKREWKKFRKSRGRSLSRSSNNPIANPSSASLQSNYPQLNSPSLRSSGSHPQHRASSSSLQSNISNTNLLTTQRTTEPVSDSQSELSSSAIQLSISSSPTHSVIPPPTVPISISHHASAALETRTIEADATATTAAIPSIKVTAAREATQSLWDEAFSKVNDETQRWMRDHALNLSSSEQIKPEDQIKELTKLITNKTLFEERDTPMKVEIGSQTIILREYIADVVAFLTMAGDVAISFAPPQASIPWAAARAVLNVRL